MFAQRILQYFSICKSKSSRFQHKNSPSDCRRYNERARGEIKIYEIKIYGISVAAYELRTNKNLYIFNKRGRQRQRIKNQEFLPRRSEEEEEE